ncbi:MAG: hypothetical protein IKI75_11480 [Lachnospiraceae bacterium]|nr:hypothetical protein [Lachnospiraceae bacterium]
MQKAAVLIPVYKPRLDADEEACVSRYFELLRYRDIYFVLPEGRDMSWYSERFPAGKHQSFAPEFFDGIKGYNKLMLSDGLYAAFEHYEYVLIAQTDAVIWGNSDELDRYISEGYDYTGAPWEPPRQIWEWTLTGDIRSHIRCCKHKGDGIEMGNGGFSLRHVKHCRELLKKHSLRRKLWFRNEDIFFGVFGRDSGIGFKPAPVELGHRFAGEYSLRHRVRTGDIPYAVHGWKKDFSDYGEMKEFLSTYGIHI